MSGHAIFVEIFKQFQLRNFPKPRLFSLLPINSSIITLRGYEERLLKDLSFLRKDLLERKPKVPHHSRFLIQVFFFEYWVEDHHLFRVVEGFTREQQEVAVLRM